MILFGQEEDQQEEDDEDEEPEGEPSVPEEFMFEAEGVALEDDMMKVSISRFDIASPYLLYVRLDFFVRLSFIYFFPLSQFYPVLLYPVLSVLLYPVLSALLYPVLSNPI